MIRKKVIMYIALLILIASAVHAQKSPIKAFPFTAEEDADGTRFVWFALNEAGFSRPYEPCKDIPKSLYYREVSEPRTGDIAWWPTFMATYDPSMPPDSNIMAAGRYLSLKDLEAKLGPVKFFRIRVKCADEPPSKAAP